MHPDRDNSGRAAPEGPHEADCRGEAGGPAPARFLPGTTVEIICPAPPRCPPRCVLFDFDGTLSLIREGWAEVMIPMMVEVLQQTGTGEPAEQLQQLVREFVAELTGRQTIYQMIRLAEEVSCRGVRPRDPLEYKRMYHERLMARIAGRREALRAGSVAREQMLVPCATQLLEELRRRGVKMYLASGTDEPYVIEEARLLGLEPYFAERIYGARDDYQSFSKALVIQRILSENQLAGEGLLGFGDGYVEIQNIKRAGGLAVGVASDEAGRSGQPDLWKRDRLIRAGADVVIPDYRHWRALVAWLWNAGPRAV